MLVKNMRSSNKMAMLTFAIFAFFLLFGFMMSELYQAPSKSKDKMKKFSLVLSEAEVSVLNKIEIHNEQGNFSLKKLEDENWQLTSPKEFLVNIQLMQKLLEDLANLKIISMMEADTINLSNFLLSDSRRKIILTNLENEEIQIVLGMSNTINNSTYIYLPGKKVIYQIESPQVAIANLDLPLLIENRVFQFALSDLNLFSLFQGSVGRQDLKIYLNNKNQKWFNKKDQELSSEKVSDFLQKALNAKSFFILDQVSEEQDKELQKHFANPQFEVVVKTKQSEDSLRYTISAQTRSLKNLDLPEESVFIKISNSKLVYVVSVKSLDFFETKESDLKPLPLKKLFY